MARYPVIPSDTPDLPEVNGPALFSNPQEDQEGLSEGLEEYLKGRVQEVIDEALQEDPEYPCAGTVERIVTTNVHDATYIDINSPTGEVSEVALEAEAKLDTGVSYNWTFTVE